MSRNGARPGWVDARELLEIGHSGLAIGFRLCSVKQPAKAIMQISSNHSGFNYNSVYKSVVTRQAQPLTESTPASQNSLDAAAPVGEESTERVRREVMKLQAAHRGAERTASFLAATPDL